MKINIQTTTAMPRHNIHQQHHFNFALQRYRPLTTLNINFILSPFHSINTMSKSSKIAKKKVQSTTKLDKEGKDAATYLIRCLVQKGQASSAAMEELKSGRKEDGSVSKLKQKDENSQKRFIV